jgi:hypothetical protein
LCFAALAISAIHLGLFKYLDGKDADSPKSIPQSYISAASHLLTTLFRATLTMSLGVAFAQYLWAFLRRYPTSVANIELLFQARQNILNIFAPGLVKSSPTLLFISTITWIIPLAVTYPPGALTVTSMLRNSTVSVVVPVTTPSLDTYSTLSQAVAKRNALNGISLTNFDVPRPGIWQYKYVTSSHFLLLMNLIPVSLLSPLNTRPEVTRITTSTLFYGEILSSKSPCGPNCTYTYNFIGPTFKCQSIMINESTTTPTSLPGYTVSWNDSSIQMDGTPGTLGTALLSFLDEHGAENPQPNLIVGTVKSYVPAFNTLSLNYTVPLGIYFRGGGYQNWGWVSPGDRPGYPENATDMVLISSKNYTTCQPMRAMYTLNTIYMNGNRTLKLETSDDGVLMDMYMATSFENATNGTWSSNEITAYEAMNLYAIFDAYIRVLAGTNNTAPFQWFNESTRSYRLDNGTEVNLFVVNTTNIMSWGKSACSILYSAIITNWYVDSPIDTNSSIWNTRFNTGSHDWSSSGLGHIDIRPENLNEGLLNVTLSLISTLNIYNTTTNAMVLASVNVYSFSRPSNLVVPYFLLLVIAIPCLVLGGVSLYSNGVSAVDGGFIQLLATTRGSKKLDEATVGASLGGDMDIPKELLDMKIRFGELVDDSCTSTGVRRAGFGTEDEIISLQSRQVSRYRQ